MHETHIVGNILRYLEDEEKRSSKSVKKICMSLSQFGGISKGHFLEHYKEKTLGTKWETLDIEIKEIPFGPEIEITRIEYVI